MRGNRNRVMWLAGALLCVGLLAATTADTNTVEEQQGAPRLIWQSPERGEALHVDGSIELVFDRAMDPRSVEAAFATEPCIAGVFTWPSETTLRFSPVAPLERDTVYLVTVSTAAVDLAGDPLEDPVRLRVTTVGYLEATQIVPAPGSIDVPTDATITVVFNRPVVPLLAASDPAAAGLPQPVHLEPEVTGTGTWVTTSVFVFTSSAPLAGGTTYTVRIASGLVDATGGRLDEDVVWEFTTELPAVLATTPRAAAQHVPVDTTITARFNMAVDAGSVEHFAVREASLFGGLLARWIPGTVEADGDLLVFTPDELLSFGERYIVELGAGVRSSGGGAGSEEATRWEFETSPLPRILETSPEDGEREAHPYTSFAIQFNTDIDPDTVMEHITVVPALPEGTSGRYSSWSHRYTLNIGAGPSSDYEVHIAPGIADRFGNTIDQQLTVAFRTAPLAPTAWLQLPGRTGTLSSLAPARFVAAHRNTSQLSFSLFSLSLEEYFRYENDWYDFEPSAGSRVRRWTVPVASPLNESAYTTIDLLETGGALEPGIYLLTFDDAADVTFGWIRPRHLLVVGPLDATLKSDEGQTLVWLTDIASGAPAPGVTLRAYDRDGLPVGEGTTDAHGVAILPGSEASGWGAPIIVADEPFCLASAAWSDGISAWDFGLQGEAPVSTRTALDTDRPIYRPGQEVHFRGIVRREDDARYILPQADRVTVLARDPTGELVYEQVLPMDEFGTFADTLVVPDTAPLGRYSLTVDLPGAGRQSGFTVAAYRPPEYSVELHPERDEVASGESVSVLVDVRYFFGAPVAEAEVEWTVFTEGYRFTPPGLERYSFDDRDDPWICWDCWWWAPPSSREVLETGAGRSDGNGTLLVSLPEELTDRALRTVDGDTRGSQRLLVEATVNGPDGQVLSGRTELVVHRGAFYVGLAPRESVGTAGREMEIEAVAVDWRGARRADEPLRYTVERREWINRYIEGAGGGTWEWTVIDTEVHAGTVTTDALGEASVVFTPPDGGSYRVSVEGTDARERVVRSSVFVWASGPGTVSWRRDNHDRLTLVPDRGSYEVGDTARILIPCPYPGENWALVTVERGTVLQHEVIRLASNSTVYELPIEDQHLPNIYVSAVIVQGADPASSGPGPAVASHKIGYASLGVSAAPRELAIDLLASSSDPCPGETITYAITALDAEGAPVRAAIAVDVVDKAVLTLMPREAGGILEAFYAPRGVGVTTASGLTISVDRLLALQLEELLPGSGNDGEITPYLAELAGGNLRLAAQPATVMQEAAQSGDAPRVREQFEDTAFWAGRITTDENGRASFELTLPDNLTTWVVRAVATTADTQVGEGVEELLVTQPLLVRPVTPRFLVVGDRVRVAASVSNNTDDDLGVEVTLTATGVAVDGDPTQQVPVAAHGEATATWWVTAEDVPHVDLLVSAVSGELGDAARPRLATGPDGTLLVYRYTAPEIVATAGQLTDAGYRSERIVVPPHYDDRQGSLEVRLDPTLAAAVRDGLSYLEGFEYACTEQLVSRFLPNVLNYRAMTRLGVERPDTHEHLERLIGETLEALYPRQRADGGWGWWTGASSPTLTAYVVFAMSEAAAAGFDVREVTIERGLDYLLSSLWSDDALSEPGRADSQAWLFYVVAAAGAGEAISDRVEALFDARTHLAHYGRALFILTLYALDPLDVRIAPLRAAIEAGAILSATGTHWEEAGRVGWAMNTDTRSTAIVLDALLTVDPASDLLPNVVRWLMTARRGSIWETTQETAWALIALTDWMVATGELEAQFDLALDIDGVERLSARVTPDNASEEQTFSWPLSDAVDPASTLMTVSRGPGNGRLYYTAHLQVHLPVPEIEPLARGIVVERRYVAASCDLGGACDEVDRAAVGETVRVRLTLIAPHDLYYVVVEDPLPAGCEAIDPELATTTLLADGPALYREGSAGLRPPWSWWWRWYSRSELRDEKVVLFADVLPAGTYVYEYSFRATHVGDYHVIPTTAHEFYFPEVFGRSDGRLFEVVDP